MCNIYNPVGCLTAIKKELTEKRIYNFNSIKELLSFLDNYQSIQAEVIARTQFNITEEKNELATEINSLEIFIDRTTASTRESLTNEVETMRQKIPVPCKNTETWRKKGYDLLKIGYLNLRILAKHHYSNWKLKQTILPYRKQLKLKKSRFLFINTQFDIAVRQACMLETNEIKRKKAVIENLKPIILGAIGEHKVVTELKSLTDEYFLINDFCFRFNKPIYEHKSKSYIRTIQIDHVLISTAGIFLIETKNWSKASLKNHSLRSPIEQIQRANYALSVLLGSQVGHTIQLHSHHWGEKRIPIKNTIVLINERPQQEFRGAYIVRLNELLKFVNRFESCLSGYEVRSIASYLRQASMHST